MHWTPSQRSAGYIEPRNPSNIPSKSSRLLRRPRRSSCGSTSSTSSANSPIDSPCLPGHTLPPSLLAHATPSSHASSSTYHVPATKEQVGLPIFEERPTRSTASSSSSSAPPPPAISTSQEGHTRVPVYASSRPADMTAGGSRAGRSVGTSSRGGQVASSRAKGKGRALDDGNASAQRALNRSAIVSRIQSELTTRVKLGRTEATLLSTGLLYLVHYRFRESMESPSLCLDQVERNVSRHVDLMLGELSMGPPVRTSPEKAEPSIRDDPAPDEAQSEDDESLILETPVGSPAPSVFELDIEPPSIAEWIEQVQKEAERLQVERPEVVGASLADVGVADRSEGHASPAEMEAEPGVVTFHQQPMPPPTMQATVHAVPLSPREPPPIADPVAIPVVDAPICAPSPAFLLPLVSTMVDTPLAVAIPPSDQLKAITVAPPPKETLLNTTQVVQSPATTPEIIPRLSSPPVDAIHSIAVRTPSVDSAPVAPVALLDSTPILPTPSTPLTADPALARPSDVAPFALPTPPPSLTVPSKRAHLESAFDFTPVPICRPVGHRTPAREIPWDPTWGMEMARKKRRWD